MAVCLAASCRSLNSTNSTRTTCEDATGKLLPCNLSFSARHAHSWSIYQSCDCCQLTKGLSIESHTQIGTSGSRAWYGRGRENAVLEIARSGHDVRAPRRRWAERPPPVEARTSAELGRRRRVVLALAGEWAGTRQWRRRGVSVEPERRIPRDQTLELSQRRLQHRRSEEHSRRRYAPYRAGATRWQSQTKLVELTCTHWLRLNIAILHSGDE